MTKRGRAKARKTHDHKNTQNEAVDHSTVVVAAAVTESYAGEVLDMSVFLWLML